jgi:hypothetical protein
MMPDPNSKLRRVANCNIGTHGKDVALQLSFTASAEQGKEAALESMVFIMSPEVARGLARALNAVCETLPSTPPRPQ